MLGTHRPGARAAAVVATLALGSGVLGSTSVALAAGPAGLPQGEPPQSIDTIVEGAGPTTTDRTIPNWHGTFTDPANGVTYGFNMVGANPSLNRDVTIPVDLIPVDVTYKKQGGFSLNGSDIIARVVASPVFQPTDFSTAAAVTGPADSDGHIAVLPGGELSAGNTNVQYLDAYMRSQFDKVGTSYHVRFGQPTVLSPWTLDCSKDGGYAAVTARGTAFGTCSNVYWVPPWGQWKLDPTHLVIFVSHNILVGQPNRGYFLGYHTAGRVEGRGWGPGSGAGTQALQTFAVTTYLDPGVANPATRPFESDLDVFSHELAEWADDPFATNIIGNSYFPLPPQDGCTDYLEVGDPVDPVEYGIAGNSFDSGPYADGLWHFQDNVFLPWFSREDPNTTSQATQTPSASIGRYSFMGDLNPYDAFHQPAATC